MSNCGCVFQRKACLSIHGEASTPTDMQLKGPAQLAVSTRKTKFKTLQDWKRLPLVYLISYLVVELKTSTEGIVRGRVG